MCHDEAAPQPLVHGAVTYIMERLSDFLSRLKAIPEGDGTLLDHCAVLGCTEVSLGQTHSILDIPILIGGSAGGALKTDHHYASLGAESVSKVALTLIQTMGVVAPSFGADEGFTDEGLDGLLA